MSDSGIGHARQAPVLLRAIGRSHSVHRDRHGGAVGGHVSAAGPGGRPPPAASHDSLIQGQAGGAGRESV